MDDVVGRSDGRRVGFRTYGPSGTPTLLYLHGVPGSRAEAVLYDAELLDELGVAVVAVDRPGYGLTDPLPVPHLLSTAEDALAVADALGMTRFAVQGSSFGGPFALAVASAAPDRVSTVVLAAPMGRMDTPWALDDMPEGIAKGWRSSLVDPDAALATAGAELAELCEAPAEAWRQMTEAWPADERAMIDRKAEALAEDLLEATRQGATGYVLDNRLVAHPWPLDPADLACDVHVFHGDDDTWAPLPSLRRSLEGALVRETVYPGGGHGAPWATPDRQRAMLTLAAT